MYRKGVGGRREEGKEACIESRRKERKEEKGRGGVVKEWIHIFRVC